MADHTVGIGGAGTLLIRDLGYQVQFHFHSADGGTYGYDGFGWHGVVNGGSVGGTSDSYPPGTGWMHVASYDVGYSQTVEFGLNDTGTWGLGGYSNMSVYISRATAPAAPHSLTLSLATPTRLGITYSHGSDGGSAILQDEAIWYYPGGVVVWTDSAPFGYTDPQDGVVGPVLTPGTEYHVYIKSRNAVGWGPPAAIAVFTLAGARIHNGTDWVMAVPYVHNGTTWVMAVPYIHDGTAYVQAR